MENKRGHFRRSGVFEVTLTIERNGREIDGIAECEYDEGEEPSSDCPGHAPHIIVYDFIGEDGRTYELTEREEAMAAEIAADYWDEDYPEIEE